MPVLFIKVCVVLIVTTWLSLTLFVRSAAKTLSLRGRFNMLPGVYHIDNPRRSLKTLNPNGSYSLSTLAMFACATLLPHQSPAV